MDALRQLKETQKQSWVHFTPFETLTTPAAARLVKHAGVGPGMGVLDVACADQVVAITAARPGRLRDCARPYSAIARASAGERKPRPGADRMA